MDDQAAILDAAAAVEQQVLPRRLTATTCCPRQRGASVAGSGRRRRGERIDGAEHPLAHDLRLEPASTNLDLRQFRHCLFLRQTKITSQTYRILSAPKRVPRLKAALSKVDRRSLCPGLRRADSRRQRGGGQEPLRRRRRKRRQRSG